MRKNCWAATVRQPQPQCFTGTQIHQVEDAFRTRTRERGRCGTMVLCGVDGLGQQRAGGGDELENVLCKSISLRKAQSHSFKVHIVKFSTWQRGAHL